MRVQGVELGGIFAVPTVLVADEITSLRSVLNQLSRHLGRLHCCYAGKSPSNHCQGSE